MEFFATKQFVGKCELPSLKMKKILGWVVKSKITPLQKTVVVLEVKMEGRVNENFIFIAAITDSPLLQEASMG